MNKNVIMVKLFSRSLISKFLADFKASKLSQLDHYPVYCPFEGGYFCSVDLEIGVCICLWEVSTYGRCPLAKFGLYSVLSSV